MINLFLSEQKLCDDLVTLQAVLTQNVDQTDGNVVAERLKDMVSWHATSAHMLASAEYLYQTNKKLPLYKSLLVYAERTNNSCGHAISSLRSILSMLKQEQQNSAFAR